MHLKRLILFPFLFITSFTADCNLLNPQIEKNNNLLLLAAYSLYGASCVNGPDIWARDLTTSSSVCVAVDLVSSGTNVEVYKERSLSINYDLVKFARDFDTITYPILISTFGTPSDVDGDGKVKILVMDIRDGATANSAYVAGYYDPVNYFPDNLFSRIRSNYAEVLYLDGKELITATLNYDSTAFPSTAAHEFQHLLRYPRMRNANQTDELWINEGTSEVASDIAGYGPQNSRMDCYSGVNDSRCSDGINGISLLDWDSSNSDILKQYSYAYVFMRYLYDISGTTNTQRQNFFRETVMGTSGTRANSTGNLITLFRTTAPNFDSALLGNQNSDVFFRVFTLLSAQSFGIGTSLTTVEQVTSDGAAPSTINLAAALTRYPFSANFARIIANPVTPTTVKGSIKQGSTNFYNTGTPTISAGSSRKNYGRVTTGTTKGIFFWADSSSGLNSNLKYVQTNEEGTTLNIPKKPRSLKSVIESSTGPIPICGIEFTDDGVRTSESIPIE